MIYELKDLEKEIGHDKVRCCPEPTYQFEIGESVVIGNLKDCVVVAHTTEHKAYFVEFNEYKENKLIRRDGR